MTGGKWWRGEEGAWLSIVSAVNVIFGIFYCIVLCIVLYCCIVLYYFSIDCQRDFCLVGTADHSRTLHMDRQRKGERRKNILII